MDCVEIGLRLPRGRLHCATWLLAQEPDVAADALELAAGAYGAVKRELAGRGPWGAGRAGCEDAVLQAHRALELGRLDEAAGGCYVWSYAPPERAEMRCLVQMTGSGRVEEAKEAARQHRLRLEAGAAEGKLSCGLFVSLGCHVPNLRCVELGEAGGAPLLHLSRGAQDEVPAAALAALALRVAAQLPPRLARREERAAAAELAELVRRQLRHLELLDAQLATAGQLQRGLLELRAGVLRDVLALQAAPAPEPGEAAGAADRWGTEAGERFLAAFRAGKRGKRYPTAAELELEGAAAAFAEQHPDAFEAAKERLQREHRAQTRGKRKAASAEEGDGQE